MRGRMWTPIKLALFGLLALIGVIGTFVVLVGDPVVPPAVLEVSAADEGVAGGAIEMFKRGGTVWAATAYDVATLQGEGAAIAPAKTTKADTEISKWSIGQFFASLSSGININIVAVALLSVAVTMTVLAFKRTMTVETSVNDRLTSVAPGRMRTSPGVC